ncbi:peptidoglycan DD-metalloendopeptidase family protein [Romeria aff. gracilis LEGE 07310]|uniref:Peptidoglycan DD-metalloendopeptidase family protein n=1 Tax=Vasconcelosia minhoensis LEGE 07310 TaxID=915328 RepID=A0A8J7AGN2_9CYAN|nr:peptidoglycan DD-metalloendopeptidase family protein [Romeria gracilis]MBE9078806.1 peptidoglycan DD-metalloendopeptidase family protein [Romeria aff. gracilis LEGE 07310]
MGLALSVGASGALFAYHDAAIAADLPSADRVPDMLSDSLQAASTDVDSTAPTYHVVEDGESLWQIAQRYHTDVQSLKAANGLSPENGLRVGLVLRVPTAAERSVARAAAPANVPVAAAAPNSNTATAASSGRTEKDEALTPGVTGRLTPQPLPQAASAPVEAAPSPLMMPVAETEPTDVLRSAGLVSQSDGLRQELESLHSAESAAEAESEAAASMPSPPPAAPAVALSSTPVNASVSYQVRSGDTVGNIARSFGISSEQLIQANAIDNPNLIIAGTQLVIPRTQAQLGIGGPAPTLAAANRAESSTAETALKREAAERSERLAHLQETAVRPLESTLMDAAGRTEIAIARAEATGGTEPAAIQADPYVASLLQDVEAIRPDQTPVVDAGTELAEPAESETVVNPEFRPDSQSGAQGQVSEPPQLAAADTSASAVDTSELLAAAPLSPDAYAPNRSRPAAGQTVSPEMPLLPDAGEYLPEAPDYFDGYIWPTRGTVTSGYGWRWGRMHRGVDVAGPVGTPIVAAAAGVIERSGWNSGGYGNLVDIRHSDGSMTRYAHNNRLLVRQGQSVRQGQQVAEMGSTGYSTGPHLHFEVHMPNQGTVNPVAYLPGR